MSLSEAGSIIVLQSPANMDKHKSNYNTGSPRIRLAQLRLAVALLLFWVLSVTVIESYFASKYWSWLVCWVSANFGTVWSGVLRINASNLVDIAVKKIKGTCSFNSLWTNLFKNVQILFYFLFVISAGGRKDNFVGMVRKNKADNKLEFIVRKAKGETLFHDNQRATETTRRPKAFVCFSWKRCDT